MKKNILITGAGAPGGPGIIKALSAEDFNLFTCDANASAAGRYLGFPFVQVPTADENEFIPFIEEYCLQHNIEIILPLVTKELIKFSEAKKNFLQKNITVIVSDTEWLAIANNKGGLYKHLQANGIAVPSFCIATSVEEVIAAAGKLNYPALPVCVKPTVSNGSRGVRILDENSNEHDLLFYQKPNHLYSTLHKLVNVLKEKSFPELLVSEYLPGREFTVDTIVFNGQPKLILPRSRLTVTSGISVRGQFEKNENIISYCQAILTSINLHGPIGLQLKENINGEYRLLEINPRLQGTSVAAIGAGINLPALAVQQEFEEIEIDPATIKWNTSFVRYYNELFY